MKKTCFFALLSALLLNICVVASEWQPGDACHANPTNFLSEGSMAVYFWDPLTRRLLYLDEENMCWYALCNKPECDHSSAQTCGAYTASFINSRLTEWEDRLYYIAPDIDGMYVYSMALDGSEQDKQLIPDEAMFTLYSFNRGKLYAEKHYGGERASELTIHMLVELSDEVVIAEDQKDSANWLLFGENVYFWKADITENRLALYQVADDGKPDMIKAGIHFGNPYIQDGFLYQCVEKEGLINTNLETGEEAVIFDIDGYTQDFTLYSDGDFLYLAPRVAGSREDDENNILLILDWDGNLLEKVSLPLLREEMDSSEKVAARYLYLSYVGATRDYIFASDSYFPNFYIEKSKIGSGECEWSEIGYGSQYLD